jgi:hypothetical protein
LQRTAGLFSPFSTTFYLSFVMLPAPSSGTLTERWADFQQANPQSRIRDAAAYLSSSEAALLATRNTSAPTRPWFAL